MVRSRNKPVIRFKGYTDEWIENTFGNIIETLTGGASIAPNDYQDDGIRTIPKGAINDTGIADLTESKYVMEEFYERNSSSKVSTGNLITSLRDLVPTAPNMGRIVRINGEQENFLMPQGVYKIEVNDKIDEDLLIAYSNSDKYRNIISREKNGSTQVHIRNGEFLNIEIFTTVFQEQKKLGSIFTTIDSLIILHQKKHDKLVTVKKSMLEKMFPKEGADVPEIRFKGFSGKWESYPLNDLVELIDGDRGKNYPNGNDFHDIGHTLFLNATNVTKNGFAFSRNQYITEEKSNSLGNGKLIVNDIILTSRGSIGHIAWYNNYVHQKEPFARINSGMLIIRPSNSISSCFLAQTLNSPFGSKQIELISFGSAQPQLTKKDVSKFIVIIPNDIAEQTTIGNYFQNFDNLISLQKQELEKLKNLKKAFLEKMFV